MSQPRRRVPLGVTSLEGRWLLSTATGHASHPPSPCFGKHLLDLKGGLAGNLAMDGSTLRLTSTAGRVHDYGKVQATGTFTLASGGQVSAGVIVLSGRAGNLDLTLAKSGHSTLERDGALNLRFTTGHGTGLYANHCSLGSVAVALHANRSHFVATLGSAR